jgi:hypothetical protein
MRRYHDKFRGVLLTNCKERMSGKLADFSWTEELEKQVR